MFELSGPPTPLTGGVLPWLEGGLPPGVGGVVGRGWVVVRLGGLLVWRAWFQVVRWFQPPGRVRAVLRLWHGAQRPRPCWGSLGLRPMLMRSVRSCG